MASVGRSRDLVTGSLAAIGATFVVLPIVALLGRVPWSIIWDFTLREDNFSAIKLSLWTSVLAALISAVLGIPIAWSFARGESRFVHYVRPLILTPIVLPPTVAGLALIALLDRYGFLGNLIYEQTHFVIPFTKVAVVISGVFVSMPYLVMVVEAAFNQISRSVEEAAEVDGASSRQVLVKVALPQVRSGIATGILLAWARSLGEFGATMMFAGAMVGVTQTWPMAVYGAIETDPQAGYALSASMLFIAVAIVFALRKHLGNPFAGTES